jgi:uncharacterized protein
MTDSQPRLTAVTLGVRDFHASLSFYEALGFKRKMRATGDEVAFFDAGGAILALYGWNDLADDADLPAEPAPQAFRGSTLAHNCRTDKDVDDFLAHAVKAGAKLLKPAHTRRPTVDIPATSPIPTGTLGKSCARRALPSRPMDG